MIASTTYARGNVLKNWKRNEADDTRSGRRQFSSPQRVDIDVLAGMSDEDLVTRFRAIDDDRIRAFESGRDDTAPWEVELAYVRREQQIRRGRRACHTEFMRRSDEEFRLQQLLPAGDFDNFAYVFAADGNAARWS